MNKRQYAVIDSKFHGGGILWRGTSLREAYRALQRLHDECYDGEGCQVAAISDDDGATWQACDIERCHSSWYRPTRGQRVYKDGTYFVVEPGWEYRKPILSAAEATSASSPAL